LIADISLPLPLPTFTPRRQITRFRRKVEDTPDYVIDISIFRAMIASIAPPQRHFAAFAAAAALQAPRRRHFDATPQRHH